METNPAPRPEGLAARRPEDDATPWLPLNPHDPVSAEVRDAVSSAITEFIDTQRVRLDRIGPELDQLADLAALFTGGGKRLRPAFCLWGWAAADGTGQRVPPSVVRAASSLDLLHVSALVHDDMMDSSDTRRGVPAAHRQFEKSHANNGWLGDGGAFGRSGAVLLGDLLVMWSVEMLERAGLTPDRLDAARPLVEAMRTEVTCGQFLDVVAQHRPTHDDEGALSAASRVVEYKSARYTVQRPLQFGAKLAGASDELVGALAGYGSPLGRAFQYRDDVLGVFGDTAVTGKPAGDDLREGKRTVLIAHAHADADASGRRLLDSLLGREDLELSEVEQLREVIVSSGALDRVEQMIESGLDESLTALEDCPALSASGLEALTELALLCVRRDH